MVLAGSRFDDPVLHDRLVHGIGAFQAEGGRVVAISQDSLPVETVVIENRAGAVALAETLVDLGYRRLGLLTGPESLLTAVERTDGLRDGLAARGISPVTAVPGEFTRDGGYEAMTEMLDRHGSELDCVVAVNDVMAVGAMAACRDRGLSLPADLGLAGFDDIETLRDVHPRLTTVRLPLTSIGEQALAMIDAEADAARRTHVHGEVVVRASTPSLT